MTNQSGGGSGTVYPDVTPDGQTPGGLIVLGTVHSMTRVRVDADVSGGGSSDTLSGFLTGVLSGDLPFAAVAGTRTLDANGHGVIEGIIYAQDNSVAADPTWPIYRGYSRTGQVFEVNVAGGVGLYGHTAPTAPRTLPQATITAITDANAKTAIQAIANALADIGALTLT